LFLDFLTLRMKASLILKTASNCHLSVIPEHLNPQYIF
jgi:hypothetical protein